MNDETRPVPAGPARDDPGSASAGDRAREAATTGREQAQEVASTATDQARSVASTAGSEAREVASTATDQARRLATDARDELRNQASGQVDRIAGGLDDLGRQLRSMSEQGEPGPVADLARQAAERTQQVASRLRDGGLDDAMAQIRSVGRNRPGLFLLGAFGAGLVAGRVARNMAQDASGGSGNGSAGNRQPATAREAGTAAGQGTPLPSAVPDAAGPGRIPAPAGDPAYATGHVAYGAPVGGEPGGR